MDIRISFLFSMLQQRLEFDFCSKADLIFSLKVIEFFDLY